MRSLLALLFAVPLLLGAPPIDREALPYRCNVLGYCPDVHGPLLNCARPTMRL